MLSTASPGNAVGITSPDKFFLWNRMKSYWRSRQRLWKPIFWQFSAINYWEKFTREQKLHQNSLLYKLPNMFLISSDMHHFEASWKRYTLENAEYFLEISFFWKKIFGWILWKIRKLSADDTMQLTLPIPSPTLHWYTIHGKLGKKSPTQ